MTTLAHGPDDIWREVNREPVSLVYFLQRAGEDIGRTDGDIKIGFTADFHDRIGNLKASFGALTLLAAEPGSLERERELHRQFRDLRITQRGEWFRAEAPLLEYIAAVSAGYGYPLTYAAAHPSERYAGLPGR